MICHFSNSDVRERLPLDSRRFYALVRRFLGMPTKGKGYGDIAPWDTGIINAFRERDDVDLHVISAHQGLKKRVVSYEDKRIHYNFVRCDIANMLKQLIHNDDLWRKFNPMAMDVHRLVSRINPDIVLLVGLENAYYSSTVLGIKDYPVYGLCQTIYNNPERGLYGEVDKKNASTEIAILKQHKYFGVYCRKHYDLLRKLAPDAIIFKYGFPSNGKLLQPKPCEKTYDFVNFAMSMSNIKGFTDAIEATAIVKRTHPDVRLNLVGGSTAEQKAELTQLVEHLNLQNNVTFTPFFEKQQDLFHHIQQSRFALLPCKMDNVSGTMTQSMQLGLPLVVYKTTGTPALNREKECVLIAEHNSIADLATKMNLLLENPAKATTLSENAREYQENRMARENQNTERLITNMKAIVANYRHNTPIPDKQLFNPEKDD